MSRSLKYEEYDHTLLTSVQRMKNLTTDQKGFIETQEIMQYFSPQAIALLAILSLCDQAILFKTLQ